MKKTLLSLFLLSASFSTFAQDAISYQLPPQAMADLLLAKPTPAVSIGSKGEWMLLIERNSYPSVEELAIPEFRIAGLRINPDNFSLSRQIFINSFTLKNLKTGKTALITGLPVPMFAGNIEWNPAENKIS
ncbi:MAG TPA: S9 family peptidase, partial [Pedobacter sp.]